MSLSKVFVLSLFFLAVHGKANFTNSQFDRIEVGKAIKLTWIGNEGAVNIELRHGDPNNLLLTETLVENLSGNSYNWVPAKDLPEAQNVLKIIDLKDSEPNYSLIFSIKGGNATWAPTEQITPSTPTTPETAPTTTTTTPPAAKKGGLSSPAKTAIYVAVPVVAIIFGVCFGLWLRNRRNDSRLQRQPIRTMTTDNTPTRNRYNNSYNGPTKPEKAARGSRSRSHTVGSDSTTSTFRRLFFNEKNLEPNIEQVSTASTNSDLERDATSPRHRASSSTSYNGKALMTPPRGNQRTTWNDSPTPPNNRRATNENIELDASNGRRYPRYNGTSNEPESPTPQRRVVSAPVLERGIEEARGSPPPNIEAQRWELSGGTPYQANARLAQSPYELGPNSRTSPPPFVESSNPAVRSNGSTQDPYAGITFGNSDNPEVIVHHLATQRREKVRLERERLLRLQELASEEEELDRQINAPRQNRG